MASVAKDEMPFGNSISENPVKERLFEEVLERENLFLALKRVKANGGSPGQDGMTVNELPLYLRDHWLRIKQELISGHYRPQPVKRVEIPKPGGGIRKLGIPTVLDRFIQQALLQALQRYWDPTFSDFSFGFRPGRSAHQAVLKAQQYIRAGYRWTVDIDLENFFDRVCHDKLMGEVRIRIKDKGIIKLISSYLKAGVLVNGLVTVANRGTPQGGPLSPLLSNLMLDLLDKELEKRGHRFVRYADDCNVYVKSRQAGLRVMESITRFVETRLKLRINHTKSAVDRPWNRKLLGFTFSRGLRLKRLVSAQSLSRLKDRVREFTYRTRGTNLEKVVADLRRYLRGWWAYFSFCEGKSIFKVVDSWIRRRLRCYLLKQWGRRGYRELRKRGVSVRLAWNTAKSAHGPWRLSRSPALSFALPAKYFDSLGLPRLYVQR